MSYKSQYNDIILTAKKRPIPELLNHRFKTKQTKLNVQKLNDEFNEIFQIHHIIPKCMGGTDDSDNLVFLTKNEHIKAHELLYKIHIRDKFYKSLKFAYICMKYTTKQNYYIDEFGAEQHINNKKIVCIDPNNYEVVHYFNSITEGEIFCGVEHINEVLSGNCYICGGYFWMLKEEWENNKIRNILLNRLKKHFLREKIVYEVILKNNDLQIVNEYTNPKIASKEANVPYSVLTSVLNGKIHHTKGKMFIFKTCFDNKIDRAKFIENINKLINKKKSMNAHSIVQMTKDKKHCIGVYPSINEVGRVSNIKSYTNISSVCRGLNKSCGGYFWMYEEEFIKTANDELLKEYNEICKN